MPPKLTNAAKANQITIIKFKRLAATYVIPFTFHAKVRLTVDDLKSKLIRAIESSGGLTLVEEEKVDLEDDIEVPKSEFIDDDDIAEGDVKVDENIITSISLEDIRLAMPKDKSSPYDNKWIEIETDEDLQTLTFNDYDILAFDYQDNRFEITEVTYED